MDKLPYLELEVFTFSSSMEASLSGRRILKPNFVKTLNQNENKSQIVFFPCRFSVPWSYGNDGANPRHSRSGNLRW